MYKMQNTRSRVFELRVTNIEVCKTATSFWLGIIPVVMDLSIAVIAGNLRDFLVMALTIIFLVFLALATCSWSNISSSCGVFRPFILSLAVLLLLYFSGFFRRFFGLEALFDLVDIIFSMPSLFICLIVPKIETHLQKSFSLWALLI